MSDNDDNILINLNNNLNINFINYKKKSLSIKETNELIYNTELFEKNKSFNIKYFKDYPNNVISSDVLINKILIKYKIKNFLNITHNVENVFNLEELN